MDIKKQRAAALKAAQDIIDVAKKEDRDLTEDEVAEVEAKHAEVEELDKKIKANAMIESINSLGTPEGEDETEGAKSLGEHFVKSVGQEGLTRVKTVSGSTVAAPEWTPPAKAAGDPQATPASLAPYLTQLDRTIVQAYRRPTVTDLFGSGVLGANSNAITYLVEGAVEGSFSTVAAGEQKPALHMADPTTRTDALKKIAGILTFLDEMTEDADFWVSEINNRGLYLLSLAEENQLLNGAGTGSTIEGLLNRSGIQTQAAEGAPADRLFKAITKVQTQTGLSADALVINPADYEALRLEKDGNDQYYGGGFFAGQYGVGGVPEQPPVWGLRTVVSPAVAAGQAVVGAFSTAATVYRKGGIRVESTNSHDEDFVYNRTRTRIEERVALAVRIPAAFVDVDLGAEGAG